MQTLKGVATCTSLEVESLNQLDGYIDNMKAYTKVKKLSISPHPLLKKV